EELAGNQAETVIDTVMPHKWEHERKKGSITSSLKMDRQSSVGSRKSKKFRSISRSLILCNAKNTDDGSSPDEKCPDPIEISTNWDQEEIDRNNVQIIEGSKFGLSSGGIRNT
uniref:Uncharacterized protein n=1 Tax=Chrysemys picta bellii TaxID=8478 RepID=A0A8C3FKD5_CHRPI